MAAAIDTNSRSAEAHHLAVLLHRMRTDPGQVEYIRTIPDGYVPTGFRYATPEETAPRNERRGRWDQETGRIVYDDGTEGMTVVTGPALIRKTPKQQTADPVPAADPTPAKEPKPKPVRQRQGAPKAKLTPWNDPRKDQVLALYNSGMSRYEIHFKLHMTMRWLNRMLREAGITPENRSGGFRPKGQNSVNAKITDAQALEIFHSKEKAPVLAERYGISASTVKKIRMGIQWSSVTGKVYQGPTRKRGGTAAD